MLHPPIASPHAQPDSLDDFSTTPGQWIYAVVCAALCVLIFFPVFYATRDYIAYGLTWRDCGTGQPTVLDVFSKAIWWSVPLAQFLLVRKAFWGRWPLRLMRCAVFTSAAIAGALIVGLSVLSLAVHR